MLNQCQFIGNLGADPEIRNTQSGLPVVNFRIAVSERWKDKSGEKQEKTTWIPIVIFNEHLCKIAEQYLHKGDKVFVSGAFQTRKWTDKDGVEKYSTEIVLQNYGGVLTMLGGKSDGARSESETVEQFTQAANQAKQSFARDLDDEVPF